MGGARVDVDTSALDRYMTKLAKGLDTKGRAGARSQAETTASQIRNTVPRRTGRLAASVQVMPEGEGFAVSYGAGVPYAAYIEKRSDACANAIEGAPELFAQAMEAMAKSEARP